MRQAAVVLCQLEAPLDASIAAFEAAGPDAIKILNTAPAPADLKCKDLQQLIGMADILCPNEVRCCS